MKKFGIESCKNRLPKSGKFLLLNSLHTCPGIQNFNAQNLFDNEPLSLPDNFLMCNMFEPASENNDASEVLPAQKTDCMTPNHCCHCPSCAD